MAASAINYQKTELKSSTMIMNLSLFAVTG